MTCQCPFNSRLSAFHDGELDPVASAEVEAHLQTCDACAGQLEEMRRLSGLFTVLHTDAITDDELTRVHEAVDHVSAESPIKVDFGAAVRFASFLTAAAASILIISAAWLHEIPAQTRPHGVTFDSVTNPNPDGWEHMAMGFPAYPGPTIEGDSRLARRDPSWEDWMVRELQN